MAYIAKELLLDFSTEDTFCFGLRCVECGTVWKSRPVTFSRAGVRPESPEKKIIFDTLYEQEKELARQQALQQMGEIFSRCPICKRLVCDNCFMICEDLDMCAGCARSLKEKGDPVSLRDNSAASGGGSG